MSIVTPEDVCALKRPTDGFLCPVSANSYGIDFINFVISDYDTKNTIFEVGKDSPPPVDMTVDFSALGEDMYRKIKYNFSEDVLRLPMIQTSLVFSVGSKKECRGFRMIERHYFRDRLVKSFDFPFGFCIPGSTNTWDAVYSMPPLSEDLIQEMIDNPYETKSDSFYFIDGKLIMHNKASYKYFKEDAAMSKKSYEEKFGSKGSKSGMKSIEDGAAKLSLGAKTSGAPVMTTTNAMEVVAEAKEASPRNTVGSKGVKQEWSKEDDYY